jgi:copper chaperone CopZ
MKEKQMLIEGLRCGHCSASTEKALNQIEGVRAVVDLASGKARIILSEDVTDDMLCHTVEKQGFHVTAIY